MHGEPINWDFLYKEYTPLRTNFYQKYIPNELFGLPGLDAAAMSYVRAYECRQILRLPEDFNNLGVGIL